MNDTTDATCLSDLTADDRLDSRDLVELMASLISDKNAGEEYPETYDEWDEDKAELLDALIKAQSETEMHSGHSWSDGVFFISEDTFKDYAEELADDIGAIDENATWPLTCIDWEQAANELKVDYTSVTIGERTYLYR